MRKLSLFAIAFLFACSTTTTTTPAPPQAKPLFGEHGFDLTGMDRGVKACDDFYRFAVGKWRETHPLPAQYSRFGRFEEVEERNRDTLRAILEQDAAATDAPAGSAAQKVGDFYAACMNEPAIEAAGISPLAPVLDQINAVSDRASLLSTLGALHRGGYGPLFRVSGQNDYQNSKMIITTI